MDFGAVTLNTVGARGFYRAKCATKTRQERAPRFGTAIALGKGVKTRLNSDRNFFKTLLIFGYIVAVLLFSGLARADVSLTAPRLDVAAPAFELNKK